MKRHVFSTFPYVNNLVKEMVARHALWLIGHPDGERADFSGMPINGCNFAYCDLRSAIFNNADLIGADFFGANLEHAEFDFAELTDVDFRHANLEYATFHNITGERIKTERANFKWLAAPSELIKKQAMYTL